MNFTDLIAWSIGVVLAWSAVSNLDSIQQSILRAQAKLIYESRTETWGSPKFFETNSGRKLNRQN